MPVIKRPHQLQTQHGAFYIVSLALASIVAISVLAGLTRTIVELQSSEQYRDQMRVFQAAEAAIDVALQEFIGGGTDTTINFSEAEGWADSGSGACGSGESCSQTVQVLGSTATVTVDDIAATQPVITSTSAVGTRGQSVEVVANLQIPPAFIQAIFADIDMEVSGETYTLVDSYDSGQGAYTPAPSTTNRGADGDIRTNSTQSDALELADAGIEGDVFVGVGGDPGDVINNQGGVTISGVQEAAPSNLTLEDVTVPGTVSDSGDLDLESGTMTLFEGTYWYDDIEVTGGATLLTDGVVTIYVSGKLELKEAAQIKGQVNGVDRPSALQILVVGSATGDGGDDQEIELEDGTFVGAIYAPFAEVKLGKGQDDEDDDDEETQDVMQFYGAVVAKDVEIKNSSFHYDTALASEAIRTRGSQATVQSWRQP